MACGKVRESPSTEASEWTARGDDQMLKIWDNLVESVPWMGGLSSQWSKRRGVPLIVVERGRKPRESPWNVTD